MNGELRSADGFLNSIKAPGHRGGGFEGSIVFVLGAILSFAAAMTLQISPDMKVVVTLGGTVAGAVLAFLLSRSIARRRQRRRAASEQEYREEQEREFRRKLAEAKAKGDIK